MSQPGPIKIAHVVRQFHPGVGGLENYVQQLASRQAALGQSVRVITLDRIFGETQRSPLPARETLDGVEVRRIPFRGSQRYPVAPGVLRHIRDVDLVHVHGVDFLADYLAATAAIHRKPMVLTTHGGFFHTSFLRRLKQLYFNSVTRAALSQYGAVVACSPEDERTFRPIVDGRLVLIPNPVDIDKFAGLADARSSTIIYFGRLAPNKKVERLIDWFAGLVAEGGRDWRLIIAGKPMGIDAQALRSQAERLGLAQRFELHESPSDDELRGLIARSAVYACASAYEGFGLAAVEAASAGLFPVLSQIPPFADSIRRFGYGLLVDFQERKTWPASYEAFETAVAGFRSGVDAAQVRQVVEPFNWAAAVPHFDAIYGRVMGRSQRRIGRVAVDVVLRDEAQAAILDAATASQPMMVAFCNAHTVNLAQKDAVFATALGTGLVLNDGVGVDVASKMLFGAPFPDNLNGTDFVPDLIASASHPIRLYLLGGKPGVAEAAAAAIGRRFAKVAVVGTAHGFFKDDESEQVVAAIRAAKPNLILIALGQPRQEQWAARHWQELPGPCLCVGALLDFVAERVLRAPPIMRKLRLEWAYRLAQEPRRLAGRYLIGNATFLVRLARQKLTGTRI